MWEKMKLTWLAINSETLTFLFGKKNSERKIKKWTLKTGVLKERSSNYLYIVVKATYTNMATVGTIEIPLKDTDEVSETEEKKSSS